MYLLTLHRWFGRRRCSGYNNCAKICIYQLFIGGLGGGGVAAIIIAVMLLGAVAVILVVQLRYVPKMN